MRMKKTTRKILLMVSLVALIATTVVFLIPMGSDTLPALSEVVMDASQGLDTHNIVATFDADTRTLHVVANLTMTNNSEDSRDTLVFRTYPNAFQSPDTSPCASEELYADCYPEGFSVGALIMQEAIITCVGEESYQGTYIYTDDAKTVLTLPLASPFAPGETIGVTLTYDILIPKASYRFGYSDDIFALGNAFAIPAVWEEGAYITEPYYSVGDPFISDCSNYSVSITMAESYICAGTGALTLQDHDDGTVTYQFDAPAVRDVAFVISDAFVLETTTKEGVLLLAYAKDSADAKTMLNTASKALTSYTNRYGAYPYQTLSLAQIDFPLGGMEYPQMVMIASDEIDSPTVIAHEVAHQWWYAVVGSDALNQAWQDEGLCEYSVLGFIEDYYSADDRTTMENYYLSTLQLTPSSDVTAGAPLAYFETMDDYTLLVYQRSAAFFVTLNLAMNQTLDEFLKTYYDQYAFSRASRQDFETLLATFTSQDYLPLMIDYLDTHVMAW